MCGVLFGCLVDASESCSSFVTHTRVWVHWSYATSHSYLALSQWNTLYQFWVHTTLIRRLGPLEWVFNTPSHHRVHHDRRVHRNYGGTLIVWDRMFGTFMDEHDEPASGKERVVYGTLTSPASWNPITVQLAPMRQLFRKVSTEVEVHALFKILTNLSPTPSFSQVCAAPTWRRAAHTFFVGPGYRPKLHRSEPPHVSGRVIRLRYRTHLEAAPNYFLLLQSATHMVALGLILVQAKHMTQSALTALLLGLCVTPLVLCGAMLDGRPWVRQPRQPTCACVLWQLTPLFVVARESGARL